MTWPARFLTLSAMDGKKILFSKGLAFAAFLATLVIAAAPGNAGQSTDCLPTAADALGPFYKPGAPQRSSVGKGYVLQGVVRSADGCRPLPGAVIELWLAGPDGRYDDEYRATLIADDSGRYQFESHVPVPYSGRPPHIHLRVTAAGYQRLVTQHYPQRGQRQGVFDLVLLPYRG